MTSLNKTQEVTSEITKTCRLVLWQQAFEMWKSFMKIHTFTFFIWDIFPCNVMSQYRVTSQWVGGRCLLQSHWIKSANNSEHNSCVHYHINVFGNIVSPNIKLPLKEIPKKYSVLMYKTKPYIFFCVHKTRDNPVYLHGHFAATTLETTLFICLLNLLTNVKNRLNIFAHTSLNLYHICYRQHFLQFISCFRGKKNDSDHVEVSKTCIKYDTHTGLCI